MLSIKNISDEYIVFAGELIRHATLNDPAEYREVERRVAEALKSDKVFLISDGTKFTYFDDSLKYTPESAIKALIAGKANEAETQEIMEWMEDVGVISESIVWENIVMQAEENYRNERYPYADGY